MTLLQIQSQKVFNSQNFHSPGIWVIIITSSHTTHSSPLGSLKNLIFFKNVNQFFKLIKFLTSQIFAYPNPIGLGLQNHL